MADNVQIVLSAFESSSLATKPIVASGERTQQPEGNSSIETGYPRNFVDRARPILQMIG
jgi:hypothetical protein